MNTNKSNKVLLLIAVVLTGSSACERHPTDLQSNEQIQAVVFQHMAEVRLFGQRIDEDAPRLFLSVGDGVSVPDADPAIGVVAHMKRLFPSTRPFAAAAPINRFQTEAIERTTGKSGIILRVCNPTMSNPESATVFAKWFSGGVAAEGFEYHLQLRKGRWVIADETRLWVN